MLINGNRKIYKILILFCFMLQMLPAGLSASGITILKHNNQTELLISRTESTADSGIELEITGEGIITLINGGQTNELRFSTGGRREKIYLYQNFAKLIPEKIIITGDDSSFDLFYGRIQPRSAETRPVPADIGHIIFSDFTTDGLNDWTVYSWNLVPDILIFDTLDYDVQSRLFKRLAFFVEKPGYTGVIVSNEELEGKHGWNAHDYKPDDLADFFSKAEEKDFILNKEELYLKKLLLSQGIIAESSGPAPYKAGKGAVLSVSRETEANWRYRFLTHECLHGIFFTDIAFKSDIYDVFAGLSPEEKEFWKHLLDYRRYDVSNEYLLVNEFMAYSLQQPMNEVNEYFKGFLYKRMTAARPNETGFVSEFERNFPESFIASAAKLEKVLHAHTGRITGHLANLYPAELKDSFLISSLRYKFLS